MIKDTKTLLGMQVKNLYGLNVIKHTKDKSKKRNFIIISIFIELFALMILAYIGLMSYGLIKIGIPNTVPTLLFTLSSVIVLVFSLFSASSSLFKMNDYEILSSLPISNKSIVASRFLAIYVGDLEICILTMLPGIIVYGVCVKPFFTFYLYSLLGALFIPMIPLIISTAFGALFTGITSRIKHKSIITVVFSLTMFILIVVGLADIKNINISELSLEDIAGMINGFEKSIKNIYIPSKWFSEAVLNNNILGLIFYLLLSVLLFIILILVIEKKFYSICNALNTKYTSKDYEIKELKEGNLTISLFKREIKRVFASSIYVTNSLVGCILMVVLSISLLLIDINQVEEILKIPGIIMRVAPIVLILPVLIIPTTSSSISMEGKEVWINQTLPIRPKDIYNSKILTNFAVVFPFYLIAIIIALIALKPGFVDSIFIIIVPIFFIIYSTIIGLSINLRFPNLVWDSEVSVVKQSLATLIAMIVGIFTGIIPIAFMFISNINKYAAYCVIIALLIGLSVFFYYNNLKRKSVFR